MSRKTATRPRVRTTPPAPFTLPASIPDGAFLADVRQARAEWTFHYTRDIPHADWKLCASTDPDWGIRLDLSRHTRGAHTATTAAFVMHPDELVAVAAMLQRIVKRIGKLRRSEEWREVKA